jgi:hypothetical protein
VSISEKFLGDFFQKVARKKGKETKQKINKWEKIKLGVLPRI